MAVSHNPHPQFQQYTRPECLVFSSWLAVRLGSPDLRVVESDEDSLLYDTGHIPGMVRIGWHHDLNDLVCRDYIDAEGSTEFMREKGISRDDTAVIYGDKSNWWATYTLWVFELFGHPDVRLLNGSRDVWMTEERDTSFEVPNYPRTDYPVVERDSKTLRAYFSDTRELIGKAPIIDVRTPEEYTGARTHMVDYPQEGVLHGGHIPTVVNTPWNQSVHPNSRFRDREELGQVYAYVQFEDEVIVYCRIDERSMHTWFVLHHLLGRENVRNHDGLWVEWGNMIGMSIVHGLEPGSL